MTSNFKWGQSLYNQLHGVFCIYKPSGYHTRNILRRIGERLCEECNSLPCYKYERYQQTQPPAKNHVKVPVASSTSLIPTDMLESGNLSGHRLAIGPRYIPEDFSLNTTHHLHINDAGVLACGIGRGKRVIDKITKARCVRVYHLKGRLGLATHDFSPTGRPLERTSFGHVKKTLLDKICAACQASHTKYMFSFAAVDDNSQEAYEIAASGLIRPKDGSTPPMLYGVKCIEFNPPDFTLEIQSINEKHDYFMELVHKIGLNLKTTAVCCHIRRIRYGHFEVDDALLMEQVTAENILKNIIHYRNVLARTKFSFNPRLPSRTPLLITEGEPRNEKKGENDQLDNDVLLQ